jgi:Sec-independent protein secretion pathway component TatC
MTSQNLSNQNNFSFNFILNNQNEKLNLELPFTEHVEELRQRSLHIVSILALFSLLAFIEIKPIVHLLESLLIM